LRCRRELLVVGVASNLMVPRIARMIHEALRLL
jgi:hypothetical protein